MYIYASVPPGGLRPALLDPPQGGHGGFLAPLKLLGALFSAPTRGRLSLCGDSISKWGVKYGIDCRYLVIVTISVYLRVFFCRFRGLQPISHRLIHWSNRYSHYPSRFKESQTILLFDHKKYLSRFGLELPLIFA